MATLDDSPSLFSGQQWTEWAKSVLPEHENEANDSDEEIDATIETDSMKLRKEDMPLFGICPSQDEFYLVVCEKCKLVVKPQAFQEHLNIRHGGKGAAVASRAHHPHKRSGSRSHGRSSQASRPSTLSSPTKSRAIMAALSPEKPAAVPHHHVSPILTKASVKEPPLGVSVPEPPPSSTAAKVGVGLGADILAKDSKLTVNHAQPVVKVERMPVTLAMKKQRESIGSARTSLTNGPIRPVSLSPVSEPVVVCKIEPDDDMKPAMSPLSMLPAPESPSLDHFSAPSPVAVSEITSAVSAILEDISPVSEPLVALVTSSATLPTTTVTMANIVTSATSVTNVTSTTSSFTFSNSRPHFPIGSIRVSFSSTGVLSAVNSLNASRTSANNAVWTSGSSPLTNGVQASLPVTSSEDMIVTSSTKPSLSTYTATNTFKSSFNTSMSNASPVKTSTITNVSSVKTPSFSNLTIGSSSKHNISSSPGAKHSGIHGGSNHNARSGSHVHGISHTGQRTSLNIGTIGSTSSIHTGGSTTNILGGGANPNMSSGVTSSSITTSASINIGATSVNIASGLPSGVNSTSSSTPRDVLKKFPLIEKPDKIIPLKDREFDPNKHCGVVCADTAKICTRSLTCKSHALSLRRAVTGRRLPFDELLQEHRDVKEAFMKAKQESREAAMAAKAASGVINKSHGTSPATSPIIKANSHTNLTKENRPAGSSSIQTKLSPQKVASSARSNLSQLSMPSLSLRDEMWSPSEKPPDKLLIDDEDEEMPKDKDDSCTAYHPRPIAACSFGARHHTVNGSSFGCHTFSRRSDHLRSAFLDLLERHLHPPPPKKLCVASNLPKEIDSQMTSKDPYDFDVINPARSRHLLNQPPGQVVHRPPTVITPVINKAVTKKPKPSISSPTVNKSKMRDGLAGSRSPGSASGSGPPVVKKRRCSGGGGVTVVSSACNTTPTPTPLSTPLVTSSNIIGNITVTSSAGGNPAFAIAIPSVSLSGANVINATLGNASKYSKNNVFKDLGFVVTGITQDALVNGQYLNISNSQLGELGSAQVVLDDKSSLNQTNVISRNKNPSAKYISSINSIDTIRAMQAGKNNLITGLPPNTLVLDGGLHPGTVLTPVSLTTTLANHMGSVGHMSFSSHQQSPATTPSPHIRSGSVSPQVSTSPLPNGVISAPPDKELLISQRHPVFQTKGHVHPHIQRGTSHQTLQLHTGTQPHQNFSFPGPAPITPVTNQINASQVLTTQFSQFQMKNSAIQKTAGSKVTMQPMSLTIPFSTGNLSLGGPHSTHTVFITSDEAQKQGLHIRQATEPQAQNSPSGTLIS